jgi:hypothetical protein
MIEEALCDLDKKAYDVVTYRELRAKIIDELELHRVTRYDVTLPESNDYSYKLIF